MQPVADGTQHRSTARIAVFTGNTRLDFNVPTVRICTSADKHTAADCKDIQ